MEISVDTILIISAMLFLALVLFFVNCKVSCGTEGYFGDQISDPFAVDYANYPVVNNPSNVRYHHLKRHGPVSSATPEYVDADLSSDPYYRMNMMYQSQ